MYCLNCMSQIPNGNTQCPVCHHSVSGKNAPHQLERGTILIGKYLVGKVIGEGGFGITYMGLDLNLELKIAIKEFFPNGFANRSSTVSNNVTIINSAQSAYFNDSKMLFLREAKNLAKFSSEKGIVDVRDYFTDNNTAYIVMEYIEGATLSEHIKRKGVFGYNDIFGLMLPVMRSLSKMHAEGLIHRDISPDNIMFNKDGTLKLMDFGAARYYTGEQKKTMSVMLKPGYTPYEQYSSESNQGPWTDVYALCATIYKCITGKTPPDSLNRAQNDTLKPPMQLGVSIPEQCQNIILYGMAIYSNNRCQNMSELISLIESVLNDNSVSVRQPNTSLVIINDDRTKMEAPPYTALTTKLNQQIDNYTDITPPYSQLSPADVTPFDEPPKNNNRTLLAILISAISVLVIGAIATVAIVLTSGKSQPEWAAPTVPVTEDVTDAAVTTTEATTVPTEPTTIKEILVPNIINRSSSDAFNMLEAASLKYKTTFEYSDRIPDDHVISQTPSEDTKVKEGAIVTFVISRGPKPTVAESSKTESSFVMQHHNDTSDLYGLGTATRYISRSDISWMSLDEIQFSINEMYARHGLIFKKDPNKSYFESMSWYRPDTTDLSVAANRMNKYEKENLKIMGAYRDSLN